MKKAAFAISLFMALYCAGFSQKTTLTGTVRSGTDSSTLAGVSVVIKGSHIGTTTNSEGSYSITTTGDDILLFSFSGYSLQELPVKGKGHIDIYLQTTTLNEVVVTALGIRKEAKSLGYSVQQVSGETMEKVKEPTVASALTGKVAGLDITNTSDFFQAPGISLRGQTPLYVIDGIPDLEGDVYKINSDDIESVSVLKGPSAAALYGSIGINGAILYTTKRGKKGRFGVDINSSTLVQTGYIRIPKVQTEYGDGYDGVYAYVDGSGSGTEGGGWIWGPKLNQKDPSTPSGYYETTQYNSPVDPATGNLVPLPWIARGKNNLKNFFQTGVLSTNNVSAYWGGDKGVFRVSVADIDQKGTMPNTNMQNPSFSIAGNFNLTDKLSLDARITYNREFSNNIPTIGYGPQNVLYNLVLWTGADVDVRDLRNYWRPGEVNVQQYNYNNSWYNNPYFVADQYLNGHRKDNTFGSFALNYDISKSFSIKARSGMNTDGIDNTIQEPVSYIAYSYISPGNFFDTKSSYLDVTSDLIMTYKHSFGKNVSLNVRAGGSSQYSNYKYLYSHTDGLTIPGFYNLTNSTNPLYSDDSLSEKQIESVYGAADLELYHFIYLSATGRNDWVSTLPVRNNHFFYPSVSLSAVLSDVLHLPEPISFLKVRGSLSQVNSGNVSPNDPYAAIQTYGIGTRWNNVPSLTWGNTLISPNLIPNTTRSWETGLALGLFKNRINFDGTYFRNLEFNNYNDLAVSNASAYQSILVNADDHVRKGWEFTLSGSPVVTPGFKWTTGLNFSNNHLWLTKATYSTTGYEGNLKVGDRMDKTFTTVYETSATGQVIYGSDGLPVQDAFPRSVGYSDPKWIYGWQNSFSHKNFTLSFSLDGRLGGLIYSSTNEKMWWGGSSPHTANHFRDEAYLAENTYVGKGVTVASGGVTYDNQGNVITDNRKYTPNVTGVNYVAFMTSTGGDEEDNHYFYYKGTYIKLRALSITYNFPKKWLGNGKAFQAGSVSLIGNNLLLFAKIPNVDPDAEADNLQTPSLRSYGLNFNLKF